MSPSSSAAAYPATSSRRRPVVERAERLLLGARRDPFDDELTRSLQGAVDRRGRRLHHGGDLGGREAEHVEQEECCSLIAGQVLQGGDEGQLDSFAMLIAGVR